MRIREFFTTDRLIAIAAALTAFTVYTVTLAPSVSFWDSGEYITCSWVAGIPHPPGVPFFVLMGRVSTLLFSFIPSIAARVNLMCAIAGTVTIGLLARLVQRWSIRMNYEPWLYRPVSVAAALLAAFSYTVWRNNNATETYAMAGVLSLLILWVFDIWLERRLAGKPAGRQLLLTGYLMTLSIGNHLSALIVVLPIFAMYVLYAVRKKAFEWRSPGFVTMFLGLMVLAFSIHLYMPLRAIQNPEINETNPSVWEEFREALERKQYGQVSILDRKGPFTEQLGLFREYLSWQVGKPEAWTEPMGTPGGAVWAFLWLGLSMMAITGLLAMGARRKDLLVLVGLTFFMASFAFVVYLNFKTGPEGTSTGEVRERDYFFGASFIFFAALAMMGAGSLFQKLKSSPARKSAWLLLVFPAISLSVNWHMCDRSGDFVARDYGINLLESCPENGVIITNGDNDTFPLWFAQGVLGVRRDVLISNLSLMNTRWYMRQLMAKDPLLLSYTDDVVDSMQPVFVWGPNFFHVSSEGLPETSAIDRAVLDQTFSNSWPWTMTDGAAAFTVPSMGRGNQGSIPMQDLLLINMLANRKLHGRDIMIAGTVSGDNRQYIDDYLQMQGITFMVLDEPPINPVDTQRGMALAGEYLTTGLTDPGIYKDDQAVQIARNYVSCYTRLAAQFLAAGDPENTLLCLDMAENLFSAMPDEWLPIMPSFVLLKSRLIMGTQGSEAAGAYVQESVAYMDSVVSVTGRTSMNSSIAQLSAVAGEFQQAQAFSSVVDSISDGTPEQEWIRIEAALAFGDYLTARIVLDQLADEYSGTDVFELMKSTVDKHTIYNPYSAGLNIMDTALAAVIGYMNQESADLEWQDSIDAKSVVNEMIGLASIDEVMAAVSLGNIMAPLVDDPDDASRIEEISAYFLADPQEARETALWYILSINSFSGDAREIILSDMGLDALAWSAESGSTEGI